MTITNNQVKELNVMSRGVLSKLLSASNDVNDRQEKRIHTLESTLIDIICEDGNEIEVCVYCGHPRGGKLGCCGEVHYHNEYHCEGVPFYVVELEDGTKTLEDI